MSPKFSVVIPVYGVEKYIRACLESVAAQTFADFEAIIVNDGTRDNSEPICLEFSECDPRFKYVKKENGGLVSARKAGAQVATGEYIVCLDGDDVLHPNYLAEYDRIAHEYNPDVICYGLMYFNAKGETPVPLNAEPGYYDNARLEKEIFPILIQTADATCLKPCLCSKAIRRTLYLPAQLAVPNNLTIGEDVAGSSPAISKASSLYIAPHCYYYYRQNEASMTKRKKPFDPHYPELLGTLLEKQLSDASFDFQPQIDRKVVHELFNVALTQFYADRPYAETKKIIRDILATPYYQTAVSRCRFGAFKGRFVHFLLKRKWCLPIALISKIKHF